MREIKFIDKFFKTNQAYILDKFHDKTFLTVTSKSDPNDLLTEVDLTIQKRFVEAVGKTYPGDLVIGEECGLSAIPEEVLGRIWVIDPIDGTYNFVRGLNPVFGVSIAFTEDGVTRAAGVLLPVHGHSLLAESGQGAYRNGKRRVRVSEVQNLSAACVEMDFSTMEDRRILLKRAVDVLRRTGQIRCQGSAAAGICQVATGDVDAYMHMSLSPWDYAGAQLIAEEAGAMATRLDGSPLQVFDGKSGVLVTNGAIHNALLSLINL